MVSRASASRPSQSLIASRPARAAASLACAPSRATMSKPGAAAPARNQVPAIRRLVRATPSSRIRAREVSSDSNRSGIAPCGPVA